MIFTHNHFRRNIVHPEAPGLMNMTPEELRTVIPRLAKKLRSDFDNCVGLDVSGQCNPNFDHEVVKNQLRKLKIVEKGRNPLYRMDSTEHPELEAVIFPCKNGNAVSVIISAYAPDDETCDYYIAGEVFETGVDIRDGKLYITPELIIQCNELFETVAKTRGITNDSK